MFINTILHISNTYEWYLQLKILFAVQWFGNLAITSTAENFSFLMGHLINFLQPNFFLIQI